MTVSNVGSTQSGQNYVASEKRGKFEKASKPEKDSKPEKSSSAAEPANESNSKVIEVDPQPTTALAPPSPRDELSLSTHGLALGHRRATNHDQPIQNTSIVDHQPIVNYTSVTNNVSTYNTTINNYYVSDTTTDEQGDAAGSSSAVNVIAPDLTALTDRLDALSQQLDDLGGAVAKFESLVLDFEARIGKLEQGDGAVIQANFRVEGLSFDNLNVALKFARQGFNVLDILNSSGGSSHESKLASASESLNRGLESLKSQSKNLLDERNPLAGFFSTNLGAALNQAV